MELNAIKSFRGCDPDNYTIKKIHVITPNSNLQPPTLERAFTELKKLCSTCLYLRTIKEFKSPIECFSCHNDKIRSNLRNKNNY